MSRSQTSLIVVSGPSGAGKSTVLSRVLAEMDHLRFSVSHTTRPPRPGEQDGVEYFFVDETRFNQLHEEGAFLEYARVHSHSYGTCRSEYDRALQDGVDLLLDLDVQGAAQVRLRFPDAVTVFILPPSYQALERRLVERGENGSERRLAGAAREVPLFREYDYAVINDELEHTVESVKSIIRAARCRTRLVEPEARRILSTFPGR